MLKRRWGPKSGQFYCLLRKFSDIHAHLPKIDRKPEEQKDFDTQMVMDLRLPSLALSFVQQQLWFTNQLEPNNSSYNIPTVIKLLGELNLAALEKSINKILQRHPILGCSFQSQEGKPVAIIAPTKIVKLPVIDLSQLPQDLRNWHSAITTL